MRAIFVNAEESGEHIEPVLQSREHIAHAPEIEMAERRIRVREAVVVRCDRRAVPVDRAVRLRARVAEGVKIACEEGAKWARGAGQNAVFKEGEADRARVAFNSGNVLLETGELSAAKKMFERTLSFGEVGPYASKAHTQLGITMQRMGERRRMR